MAHSLQVGTDYRHILKMALPISLSLLVPQLNLIINSVFLGHLNEEALAAASITGVYYLIFAGIGFGLNNGLQAFISRKAGENKPGDIGVIFQQGILISLAIGLFGILFTWTAAPSILKASIHSPKIYSDAVSFLNIRIIGLPFLYVYQMRNALLVGINQSRLLVIGTAAEAMVNVLLDYGLIFGKLGLPQMGFNGAAVASVAAELTGMLVIFLVVKANNISKQFRLFTGFNYNKAVTLTILKLSGPLIFQMVISITSWFFFYVLVEHHGQRALAISNTMRNVFGFFGIFSWAFASSANSMVSNVIGQGKKEAVVPLLFKIMRLSCSVAVVVCLLLNLFPGLYFAAFGQGADFIKDGIPTLRVVACAIVVLSAGTVWLNAVTGTGSSNITFIIELVAIIVYCIYVWVVLTVLQLNITIGWAAELLYWITMFAASFWYIRSKRWMGKEGLGVRSLEF